METATRKWLEIAEDDWGVAQLAFSHARYLHAVVMAQQAVEKVLKALIAEATNHVPPKKHQLTALANEAGVLGEMSPEDKDLLSLLTTFYIEGRYPDRIDEARRACSPEFTRQILWRGEELIRWLKQQIR